MIDAYGFIPSITFLIKSTSDLEEAGHWQVRELIITRECDSDLRGRSLLHSDTVGGGGFDTLHHLDCENSQLGLQGGAGNITIIQVHGLDNANP